MNPVTYREMKAEDKDFVFNSWLRSFRKSHYAGPIPYNLYYKFYQQVIEQIFGREGVSVLMAVSSEDKEHIIGYAVRESGFDKPVIHYCYVKQPFRGHGIARELVGSDEFYYTFRTPAIRFLPSKLFNPSLVRKKKDETKEREIS